jgi:hypothetical protein
MRRRQPAEKGKAKDRVHPEQLEGREKVAHPILPYVTRGAER